MEKVKREYEKYGGQNVKGYLVFNRNFKSREQIGWERIFEEVIVLDLRIKVNFKEDIWK